MDNFNRLLQQNPLIQNMAANASLPSLFSNSQQWLATYDQNESNYCSPSAFVNIDIPSVNIINLRAEPRNNYTYTPPFWSPAPMNQPVPDLNFCNITITYEHPGWNDPIVTSIFLPTDWNGRYMATGGGGWITGGVGALAFGPIQNLQKGFATATTDGGHVSDLVALSGPTSPWALSSPGNVNWPLLVDFAYVSLHDMVLLSKSVIADFYKEPAKYSYWFGGSQGGRQGHMMAQRYPEDFDGIFALFPAINWAELMATMAWTTFVMDLEGVYPPACELDAITRAAIDECDALDGVSDGLISRLDLCTFEAQSVVDQKIDCNGSPWIISQGAANIVQAAWDGPRSSTGKFQWDGYLRGTNISARASPAATNCDVDNSTGINTCQAVPNNLPQSWYSSFVLKNNSQNIRNISHQQWDDLWLASKQEYNSMIGTNDPDLSRFKRKGKMITWHGMTDPLIPCNNTARYYDRVAELDPQVHDYFRFFLAPGIGHSFGTTIQMPDALASLLRWVENGVAPDGIRQVGKDPKGNALERDLCPYPKVQHYVGGDSTKAEAFKCV